jgi:hypothetical protein
MKSLIPCALAGLVAFGAVVAQVAGTEVKPSVRVEMHGTLSVLWSRIGPRSFHLDVNGTTYHLLFANATLKRHAERLEGQTVVVTGELKGQIVHVESIAGEPGLFVPISVPVKIKGKIAENMDLSLLGTGQTRLFWEITVHGKKYQLDLSGDERLMEMAKLLRGQTVVITGEIQQFWFDDVIPLSPAKMWEKMPMPIPVARSSTVTVTGLAVEPGEDEYYQESPAK